MPTWGQVLQELGGVQQQLAQLAQAGTPVSGISPFDIVRRRYLAALAQQTGRAVIVYASAFLEPRTFDAQSVAIHLGDVQGFMEACSNIEEKELDLFLHSPGGNAEAAESIVEYLRTRFDHIRAVVPIAAMSAATMMALGADEVVMGAHSQLGPIDPQFTLSTPEGPRSSPAQAILDQFDIAKTECQDPRNLPAWLPILRGYAPGLIAQCGHQRDLAESFVAGWLERFMFNGDADRDTKAKAAAAWFADFSRFKSHGRRVSREEARDLQLRVTDLETDPALQDAMLSVHHAVSHTLSATPTAKIIENHHGRAWMVMAQQVIQVVQSPPAGPAPAQAPGQPPAPGQPT